MRPIDQQTILITGATDGLGRALAARLAAEGATVLVHGRDDRRGKAALQEIGGRAAWYRADLASLAETRALAEAVRADHPRLDVLVNNAGIGGPDDWTASADGHELTFAVNYLSGYLLTRLLLPTLISSAPARIVNVSSLGQQAIDFDDVMLEHRYRGFGAYCQSKLAQVLFTIDLADELAGTGVTANALHPATFMPTKMVSTPASTLEEGVEATHRLVTDPALDDVSGRFFNGLREARADDQAYDPAARARLHALSETLTSP
ncbi:SDR family NAD(P)-dependent oxidoreductase [Actinomadura chokoriensis]|uniref:SDR family NAD(P)-dependent oxidoreductase n=1 Tax=Actinomadura chokoriensis TaxID=454156 RepID=UPI0031F87416